jgi:hypothetical protein
MNTQNKPQAFEVNNTAGRAYWGMGILWTMLATAEDTNGAYSCIIASRCDASSRSGTNQSSDGGNHPKISSG